MEASPREELIELIRLAKRYIQERVAEEGEWLPVQSNHPELVEGCKPDMVRPDHHGSKKAQLAALYAQYKSCVRCPLGETRIQFVFGVGNPAAEVLFIGEGPGYEEDRKGEPFVGKAGQLLDKILASIGLSRQTVYITNIVKCHAMVNPQTPEARGNDRPPNSLEVETCSPILRRQIEIIQPRVIVTLGSPATRALLQTTEGVSKLRGKFYLLPTPSPQSSPLGGEEVSKRSPLPSEGEGPPMNNSSLTWAGPVRGGRGVGEGVTRTIQVLPTYHPAALLRNPELKRDVWEDMKLLRQRLTCSK